MTAPSKESAQSLRVDAYVLQYFRDNPNGFIDKFTTDVNERARSQKMDFNTAFQQVLEEVRGHLRQNLDKLPPIKSENVVGDKVVTHDALISIRGAMEGDYNSGQRHSAAYYANITKYVPKGAASADALAPSDQLGREGEQWKKQNMGELTAAYGSDAALAARKVTTSFNNDKVEAAALSKVIGVIEEGRTWGEFFRGVPNNYSAQVNKSIAAARETLQNSGMTYNDAGGKGQFTDRDLNTIAVAGIEAARNKQAKER